MSMTEIVLASETARLAGDGNVVVECIPIDDLAPAADPTFIKMDIEGAELDALAGARRSIQTHRPILSISVYHKQDTCGAFRSSSTHWWKTTAYSCARMRSMEKSWYVMPLRRIGCN